MNRFPAFLVFFGLGCLSASLSAAEPQLAGAQVVIEAINYPSIQAAIDAVPQSGGMLRLPPGELVIEQPLIIRHEDFCMEGAGTATHIQNVNTDGQPAIIIRSDKLDEKNPLQQQPLWRVRFSNFRITGNEKSGHGIEAVWVNELFIQGVTASYHGGDAIRCHYCVEDMRLSNSLITYNLGAGLRAQGNHDTIVSACQFEENLDGVVFTDGFNLTLSGNNIDDHLRHGVTIENSMGSLVSANMIEQCKGSGLVLARDTYGTSVTGNLFAQNFCGGVDLRDAHGIPITGNTFVRCKQYGVRISSESSRSVVNGNTFCDTFAGQGPRQRGPRKDNPDINEAAGILLESAHDVTIVGNSMSGLVTKGLTLIGECEHIVEEHNQAIACTDIDAKVTKSLSTGPAMALSSSMRNMQTVAVLDDETALTGAHDIEVRDGTAYIAGKGFTRRNLPRSGVFPYEASKGGSLAIVDVNQPNAPKVLWTASTPLTYEDAETVLPLGKDRLLVGARDLFLFDVKNPRSPRQLVAIQDRPRVDIINGFAQIDTTVFGANKAGHLLALDVSNSDSVKVLGSRETRDAGELGSPHDVAFCGDLLLLVSPEGFGGNSRPGRLGVYRVIDEQTRKVLPSEQWSLISRLEHPRLAGANRVMTGGKFAYVGCSLSENSGRADDLRNNVSIIDLSDPAQPRLRGSVDFPDPRGPNGLEIAGNIVFAAGGQTVQAIDVSNPETPNEIGRVTDAVAFPGAADDAHDLVLSNGHLFVTAQTSHSLVVIRFRK